MTRRPVSDWTTDFDHYDPEWTQNPFALWEAIRGRCTLAQSRRYGGMHFPVNWSDIRAVASDPDRFSSRYVDIRDNQTLPPNFAPPITTDPPTHRSARARLVPRFSTFKSASFPEEMRAVCGALIASFADSLSVDAVEQFARPASARLVGRILDLPIQDVIDFQSWSVARRIAFLDALTTDRRRSPGDDLVSDLIREASSDATLDDRSILGSIFLVLVAGVDTTAAVIGGGLLHLATHLQDQSFLRDHPDRIPRAAEEFLRVHAPVVSARVATQDTELAGCPMRAGEMVLLSFAAANRDPLRFPDPETVSIHRTPNNHAAFGMGVHHCLGAELARQTLRAALETWLARIPAFRLAEAADLTWTQGSVRGLRSLPLELSTR